MEETLERGQKITLEKLKKMGWQELEFPESKDYGLAIILKKDKKRMLYDPKKGTVGPFFEPKSSTHRKKEREMKGRKSKIKEIMSSVFLREGIFKIGSPTLLKIVQQNGFSDCSEKEFLSIIDEMEKTKAICTKEELPVDETPVGQLNFSIYPL